MQCLLVPPTAKFVNAQSEREFLRLRMDDG